MAPKRTGKILTTFRELGVLPEIADALERVGIVTPFPIQEMTLSVALMGTDLIGQARTGTGKTLAFGIPVLQRTVAPHDPDYAELAAPGKPQALIVAPTRELALQVSNDLHVASKDRGTRVLTVYGGVGYDTQLDALKRGVDVVVGTPGRLIDLVEPPGPRPLARQGAGPRRGRRDARPGLPARRRAADLPRRRRPARRCCSRPPCRRAIVVAGPHAHAAPDEHPRRVRRRAADRAGHRAVHLPGARPRQARARRPHPAGRERRPDDRVHPHQARSPAARRRPEERGFDASPLHGDMQQVAREKALDRFREGKLRVLVATDVAARGIDVADVTHVINYTCPEDEKTYVHRIGRTGRAGATGIAVTFVDWADVNRWKVDQQGARPAVRRAGRDLLHLRAPLPRHGHRARHQGPPRAREAGRAAPR